MCMGFSHGFKVMVGVMVSLDKYCSWDVFVVHGSMIVLMLNFM